MLSVRTRSSYDICYPMTAQHVADHLAAQGWQQVATCATSERYRMRSGRGLIVIWEGTALIQGRDPEAGHRALGPLVTYTIGEMFRGATYDPR